jgi:GT2 family glycosyltransferase
MAGRIAIAAVPKPFEGHTALIQCNAIRSWARLPIEKDIYLIAETSAQQIGEEVGATVIPDCPVDEYHTPLFGPAIELAARSGAEFICYLNADIVALPELAGAIEAARARFGRFLMVAKRWNYDCEREFDFADGWEGELRADVHANGALFAPQAIDMFGFTPDVYDRIPPFAIGRSYWDNWMVDAARRAGAEVLDVTDRVMLVHQNHAYTGFENLKEIRGSVQGRRNFFLAGDSHRMIATIDDATHRMAADGTIAATDTASVSVIIPFAGRQGNLRRLLNTLVHQKYARTFIEIVVVINKTEIDLGSLKQDFPHVRFTVEMKKSAAAARNKGFALSSGDIIAFIDDDCVPDGRWIAAGVEALAQAGEKHFVGGAIEQVVPGGAKRSVAGALGATLFLQQQSFIAQHGACVTANMFVRRADFAAIGWFDEDFLGAAGEDWEWCQRARRQGFAPVFAPDVKVRHPMLRDHRALADKLDRIAHGNLRLAAMEAAAKEGNGTSKFRGPDLGWYVRRCAKAFRDPRLTSSEKLLVPLLLARLLPGRMRNWSKARRALEQA